MVFNMEPTILLDKYAEASEAYDWSLKNFEISGREWLRRNQQVRDNAKYMVSQRCLNQSRIGSDESDKICGASLVMSLILGSIVTR